MALELTPGEKIIYRAKPHWILLARPAVSLLIALSCSCTTGLLAFTEPLQGMLPPEIITIFAVVSAGMLGMVLLAIIATTLNSIFFDFVITNRRLVAQMGGVRRRSYEVPLNRIDSVFVESPLAGRIFGYGTVVINSGLSRQRLTNISNPQEIRQRIQVQMAAAGTRRVV